MIAKVVVGVLLLTCPSVLGERVPRVLDRIMAVSNGDLRKAITYLQSTHTFYGADLDVAHIVQIAGVIPDAMVQVCIVDLKGWTC